MPRLPLDDRLLTAQEAAWKIGMHRCSWYGYAKRYPLLMAGRRWVKVSGNSTRGVLHWLNSALVAHMHIELGLEMAEFEELERGAV